MRLPNQAKPVLRHASRVEAGVNPSFLGGVIDKVVDTVTNPVKTVTNIVSNPLCAVRCVSAIARCGSNPLCLARRAPQCLRCL